MHIHPITVVEVTGTDNHSVYLRADDRVKIQVSVLEEDMLRVQMLPDGDYRLARTWQVVGTSGDVPREGRRRDDLSPFSLPAFEQTQSGDALTLKTKSLSLNMSLSDFRLTWTDANGSIFAEDSIRRAYAYNPQGREIYHYMQHRDDVHYYGFGEKAGELDKSGTRLEMRTLDALGYSAKTTDPLYKHWSFYITYIPHLKIAYGLFYDNLAHSVFDMGREHHAYYGFYRSYQVDDGDLDYYLMVGQSIESVVEKFTKLIGRMILPPRWSLGYLGSTMTYTEMPDAEAQLASFIEKCRNHDIPCSLFHLSSGYTTSREGKRYVFNWNYDKFPYPDRMVNTFHDANIKLAANIKPYMVESHPKHAQVRDFKGFIQNRDNTAPAFEPLWAGGIASTERGAHVDFTNPESYVWWQQQATEQLLNHGIDSTWNDNNEFPIWDDDAQCNGFGEPIRLGMIRALHTLLMVRASYEAQVAKRPDERPFVLTRSGCPGIQRYAQTWSGDNTTNWETLKYNIPMALNAGLSGMANTGHDVGGFFGSAPSPELLVRWVQNGIFHPRFCIHSLNDGASATEPWMYPEVLPEIRKAINLRYKLIPYLYSLFYEAAQTGHPIIRPMVYQFPDDPYCRTESFDFMLGSQMLVASVYEEGDRIRSVYLPQGVSWCYIDGKPWYKGGQTVTLAAPLDRIPLLIRQNGILPVSDVKNPNLREVRLYPVKREGSNTFTLIEDDGVSLDYQQGKVTQVRFTLETTRDDIRLHIDITGGYALPYADLTLIVDAEEERPLTVIQGQHEQTVDAIGGQAKIQLK
jgi:alpha-glucosidase